MNAKTRPTVRQAARGIWRVSTENGMASRWVTAAALSALWMVVWWAVSWVFIPPMPHLLHYAISLIPALAIFWFIGPTGYGIRYLVADWRIWRRRRKSTTTR